MDRITAIGYVRDFVVEEIRSMTAVIEECKARHETYEEEQEYLDQLVIIEDMLYHMI